MNDNPAALTAFEESQDIILMDFMAAIEAWQATIEGTPSETELVRLRDIYGDVRQRFNALYATHPNTTGDK